MICCMMNSATAEVQGVGATEPPLRRDLHGYKAGVALVSRFGQAIYE
jgi:hypothetical protein